MGFFSLIYTSLEEEVVFLSGLVSGKQQRQTPLCSHSRSPSCDNICPSGLRLHVDKHSPSRYVSGRLHFIRNKVDEEKNIF